MTRTRHADRTSVTVRFEKVQGEPLPWELYIEADGGFYDREDLRSLLLSLSPNACRLRVEDGTTNWGASSEVVGAFLTLGGGFLRGLADNEVDKLGWEIGRRVRSLLGGEQTAAWPLSEKYAEDLSRRRVALRRASKDLPPTNLSLRRITHEDDGSIRMTFGADSGCEYETCVRNAGGFLYARLHAISFGPNPERAEGRAD